MNFTISFQNEHVIYEQNVKCTVKEYEFNNSYNPSLLESGSSDVKGYVTASYFTPYVTTVGLYNDNHELLAVAKFAQPIPLSQNTDTNFMLRIDR